METARSLDTYEEVARRELDDDALRERLAALGVLREYFLDYAGLEQLEQVKPEDLRQFALDWLLRSGEADAATAAAALAALRSWITASARSLSPGVLPEALRLLSEMEIEVPRALKAAEILAAAARGEDLDAAELATEGEAAVGALSAGFDRTVSGDLDWSRAAQDEYRVESVAGAELLLRASLPGAAEAVPPVGPVRVPAAAASLLRPGDILNLEIAPGEGGWEVVDVLAVYPAGFQTYR